MAMKWDMRKVFGRVECSFLRSMVQRLGLDPIWIGWIMKCITLFRIRCLLMENLMVIFGLHVVSDKMINFQLLSFLSALNVYPFCCTKLN
jgi:hypothetical protein